MSYLKYGGLMEVVSSKYMQQQLILIKICGRDHLGSSFSFRKNAIAEITFGNHNSKILFINKLSMN